MTPASIASFTARLLLCTLPFFYTASTAQIAAPRIFSLEEDNKPVKINTIFKNHQGYIYAGGNKGLYKFDGIRYYRIDFANKDYTDTVTAISEDAQQKMWIGFRSGRIAHIANGRLVYFNPEEGTPAQKINFFLHDKAGNTWFATNGEGVYYLKQGRTYLVNADNGLTDGNVSALALADNGDILAATDQGINFIRFRDGKTIVTAIGPKNGLPDYIVSAIIPAGNNCFWIGMQDNGFCLYNHSTGQITVPAASKGWKYGQVNALLQAQDALWIATEKNGLLKLKLAAQPFNDPVETICRYDVNSMLEDNQGNIWLSVNGGLVRTPGESVKIFPLPLSTVFEHIHTILSDKQANLWLTNEKNELIKSSFTKGNADQKIHLNGINEKTDITSLYQDKFENIWIGTMGKGIYVLNPHNKQYRVFSENPAFKGASILSITGRDNTVFASSLQGSMVITLTEANKNINSRYLFSGFDKEGIGSNYIYTIFKDSKKRTWFATDGKGLSVLDNGAFTIYDLEDQIKDDRVFSITEDNAGNIWFSTGSAGIYKFDGEKFRNYSIREGLSDLYISAIKTDKWGNLVIIHKKGMDILDPVTDNIYYINNNRGISGLNVEDLGAVSQDSARNIFVSSENGIVVYSPAAHIDQKPKTVIESVQLFLNMLDDSAVHTFSHEDNSFTFNYTGLYYTDPEQVYYQYKLEGFDTSWILTKDRSKTFPKLAPGKYTFRIRSSLNRNFVNADEASWSFVIRQAFYKKWWFIFICFLIAGALLYWYIKNREAALKKMERLRQEKIEFRFEVLRNQVNPHFLFNSFNTLISTIEDDPKKAVEYVEQLSDFFRNIVSYRDKDVIALQEEMELLYTYFFLQKKRYGENLQLAIMVSEADKRTNFIPPLTLQLLMENAIKHNSITRETPLIISIDITNDRYLTVKNNISLRISKEPGAGMGLQNIMNRYNLLTNKKVKISHTGSYFIVSLPLIHFNHA
jgi:ligand-binding sensor domain-containing protein